MNKKSNRYYVYVFVDPTRVGEYNYGKVCGSMELKFTKEPFYVGKGSTDRLIFHIEEVLRDLNKGVGVCDTVNKAKFGRIKELIDNGYTQIDIVSENITEGQAFQLEKLCIVAIGTVAEILGVEKRGPLLNMTKGGDGFDSETAKIAGAKSCVQAGKRSGKLLKRRLKTDPEFAKRNKEILARVGREANDRRIQEYYMFISIYIDPIKDQIMQWKRDRMSAVKIAEKLNALNVPHLLYSKWTGNMVRKLFRYLNKY
jgi:hypothetical protein